jgi:hypothetical protein
VGLKKRMVRYTGRQLNIPSAANATPNISSQYKVTQRVVAMNIIGKMLVK